ncbi:hypothetical protein [Geomicrobium sp. JCM 19039]|nr:hypothetical protein [Geomicrobium sp. JCM 19039]
MQQSLPLKERCVRAVKYQKKDASVQTMIAFVASLLVLLVFM